MIIAVIGAGYVGLPLAIAFAKHHQVICFDIDKKRIEELLKGIDSNLQHSQKEITQKKLCFVNSTEKLKKIDIYIVAVPTPINQSNLPDLSMLKKASILVGQSMKKNSTIIYESTTYPGCTE